MNAAPASGPADTAEGGGPTKDLQENETMPQQWYYSQGDQQVGPVAVRQLRDLAAAGKLRPTDLVWTPGMPEWKEACSVRGLFTPAPNGTSGSTSQAGAPRPSTAPPPTTYPPVPAGGPDLWYVLRNQMQYGPYTMDQLRALAASGDLTADALVRTAQETGWRPVEAATGLACLPAAGPAGADPMLQAWAEHRSRAMWGGLAVGCFVFLLVLRSIGVFSGGASSMSAAEVRAFGDAPKAYKGRTLTVKAEYQGQGLGGYIEDGVMPIDLEVPFRVSGYVNGGRYEFNLFVRVPKGMKVPPLASLDDVLVTFRCGEGQLDDGNLAMTVVRP